MNKILIAGVDEAGRGPVLGSLVVGCVLFEEDKLHLLEEHEITDSKQLTAEKRQAMAEVIYKHCKEYQIYELTAPNLDEGRKHRTLNEIEVRLFAQVLNDLKGKPDEIYLDAADVKEDRFGHNVKGLLSFSPKRVISKHKGDSLFRIVGAASILAKVKRDAVIEGYKRQYGEIGSGYPGDRKTRLFLKNILLENNFKYPEFVRQSWATAQNILCETKAAQEQRLLTDF